MNIIVFQRTGNKKQNGLYKNHIDVGNDYFIFIQEQCIISTLLYSKIKIKNSSDFFWTDFPFPTVKSYYTSLPCSQRWLISQAQTLHISDFPGRVSLSSRYLMSGKGDIYYTINHYQRNVSCMRAGPCFVCLFVCFIDLSLEPRPADM